MSCEGGMLLNVDVFPCYLRIGVGVSVLCNLDGDKG